MIYHVKNLEGNGMVSEERHPVPLSGGVPLTGESLYEVLTQDL